MQTCIVKRSKTEKVLVLTAHFIAVFMQFGKKLEITGVLGVVTAMTNLLTCVSVIKGVFTFVALRFYFGACIFHIFFLVLVFWLFIRGNAQLFNLETMQLLKADSVFNHLTFK